MPVKTVRREGKFRVVESSTGRLCRTSAGFACDGGGHRTQRAAQRQVTAINLSKRSR